jgi:hypothetical protein
VLTWWSTIVAAHRVADAIIFKWARLTLLQTDVCITVSSCEVEAAHCVPVVLTPNLTLLAHEASRVEEFDNIVCSFRITARKVTGAEACAETLMIFAHFTSLMVYHALHTAQRTGSDTLWRSVLVLIMIVIVKTGLLLCCHQARSIAGLVMPSVEHRVFPASQKVCSDDDSAQRSALFVAGHRERKNANSHVHVTNAHLKRLWPGHVNERMAVVEALIGNSPSRTSSERVVPATAILAFLTTWRPLVGNSLRSVAAPDCVVIVSHYIVATIVRVHRMPVPDFTAG